MHQSKVPTGNRRTNPEDKGHDINGHLDPRTGNIKNQMKSRVRREPEPYPLLMTDYMKPTADPKASSVEPLVVGSHGHKISHVKDGSGVRLPGTPILSLLE